MIEVSFKRQNGVSLIEILVTILILGIGLLGVASLQVSSIASNQEGFYTSQATSIAEDFASRIRSAKMITMVPDSTVDYATFLANYVVVGELSCTTAPTSMCKSIGGSSPDNCGFTEMALFEQWEACSIAEATLPEGKVRIVSTGDRLSIIVDWSSASERKDLGTKKIVNQNCAAITGSSERNCVMLEVVP